MDEDIQYGPLARGIYIGLLWLTVLLAFTAPFLVPLHVGLLLFLGLGLEPFLKRTGLLRVWRSLMADLQKKRHADHHAEAARHVERKRRDEKHRKTRVQIGRAHV